MCINVCLYVCLCIIYLSGISPASEIPNLTPLEEKQGLLKSGPSLQLYIYLLLSQGNWSFRPQTGL